MCITLTLFCSLCVYTHTHVYLYISTFTSVYMATAFSLYLSDTDISVLICHLFVAHLLLGCTFLDTFTCCNPICVCVADVSAAAIHKLHCARRVDQEHSLWLVKVCSRSHCFCILEEWGHFRNKMLAFRELYNCTCKLKTY